MNYQIKDCRDYCSWVVYDSIELRKGVSTSQTYEIFGQKFNYDGFLKDFNTQMGNQLPAPQQMYISNLNIVGSRSRNKRHYNTVASFYNNYGFELMIGQKSYYQSSLQLFPINADWEQIYNELYNEDGTVKWRVPDDVKFDPQLVIYMGQFYRGLFKGKSVIPEVDAKITVGLRGVLERGVA